MSKENDPVQPAFDSFGLSKEILKGIEAAGFQHPSPIQAAAIPLVLQGRDLIGQAQTGTGKTAAFGLPSMSMLKMNGSVEILVIAPTRELASQISDELYRLGKFADAQTVAIYGGQSYGRQLSRLERGAQIVVATPGRLLDLLSRKKIKNFSPSIVVLDEADEMLDMGFLEDIEKIFEYLPEKRQTLMFSATMPKPIRQLADRLLVNPEHIKLGGKQVAAQNVRQQYYVIDERERDDAILRLMDGLEPSKSIVFCRTKAEVDRVSQLLEAQGFLAKGLHGDMDQRQRNSVIGQFKSSGMTVLVATDVAARGLDVADVTHVFNFHIPFDAESYVHRIGRTGRAGKDGLALTLVTPREFRGIQRIQDTVGDFAAREMPTASYVRRTAAKKIEQSIREQEIDEIATALLEKLSEDMDPSEIAARALTVMLAKDEQRGPELIGLSHKEIKSLAQRSRSNKGRDGRPGRKGGGYRKRGPGGSGGSGKFKKRGPGGKSFKGGKKKRRP